MSTLHQVDLNLWVVLGHLLETSSVSLTAKRLGRTQSAVSHSLAALRQLFDDPLFVRIGARLEPSARARELAPTVKEALRQLEASLAPPERFDPSALRRVFRIFLSDYAQVVLLPALLTRLEEVAPKVVIDVTFRADAIADVLREVRDGRYDLSVGPPIETVGGIVTQTLFADAPVCAVRVGHPFVTHRTAARYAALRHLMVSARGGLRDFVDDALETRGLSRVVVARVPHFTAALALISRTDMVALVPERLARAWTGGGVRFVKPPLPLPGFSMAWYVSDTLRNDPASIWLRSELRRVSDRM